MKALAILAIAALLGGCVFPPVVRPNQTIIRNTFGQYDVYQTGEGR